MIEIMTITDFYVPYEWFEDCVALKKYDLTFYKDNVFLVSSNRSKLIKKIDKLNQMYMRLGIPSICINDCILLVTSINACNSNGIVCDLCFYHE